MGFSWFGEGSGGMLWIGEDVGERWVVGNEGRMGQGMWTVFKFVSGNTDDGESDAQIMAYKGMRMRAIAIDVCILVAICVALR